MERWFKRLIKPCIYTICAIILGGCKGIISTTDMSADLASMAQPTFGGATSAALTTPSHTYTLNGECAASALEIEWSLDQSTWTSLGNCAAGTFTISGISVSAQKKIYVRAKGPQDVYSAVSVATVRYIFPATSDTSIAFVSAGSASEEMQFGLEHTMSQEDMSDNAGSPSVIIQPSIIGAARYE